MLTNRLRVSLGCWLSALALLGSLSCEDLKEPPPAAPGPVQPPPPSQFNITGHWEMTTDQGRRIAFDVTADGRITNTRVNVDHDCTCDPRVNVQQRCNTGLWRTTIDGLEAQVVDSAFLANLNWRNVEDGIIREGTLSLSGRFESDTFVRGGYINSVKDVREAEQPTGEICPTIQGSYEGTKEQ